MVAFVDQLLALLVSSVQLYSLGWTSSISWLWWELPKDKLEGSLDTVYHDNTHTDIPPKVPEEIEKLEYIYQHFQDHEEIYETDQQVTTEQIEDTLYPQINNDIE